MSRYRVNPETAELEDIEYILDDKPSIVDMIYPINSIYISMVNVNPSSYWEGTQWELLSDGYLRNNAAAATGGSENSGGTALTTAHIPSHSHLFTTGNGGTHSHTATTSTTGNHNHSSGAASHTQFTVSGSKVYSVKPVSYTSNNKGTVTNTTGNHSHTLTTSTIGNHTHAGTTAATGGGTAHTHTIEPTYTRVYAYKRIA